MNKFPMRSQNLLLRTHTLWMCESVVCTAFLGGYSIHAVRTMMTPIAVSAPGVEQEPTCRRLTPNGKP